MNVRLDPLRAVQTRNICLYLQGLSEARPQRLTPDDLYALIVRLGFVQVDSIRAVERAHHLTLFSRNEHYQPRLLQTLLEQDRRLFEHWTHYASIIPMLWYPYWQRRFADERFRLDRRA